MSDNGAENLTLRCLRSIDERLARLETATNRGFEAVAARFVSLEGRLIAIEGRLTALEAWSAEASGRLDHIERRLDLVDHER
jgi:hypothetical protein